jgi:hypothetical protein
MEGEVKVKVKVKYNLKQATKTQRVSRGIAFIFNLGAGKECVVNATFRPLYPRDRLCTHCTRGWEGSILVWTGA